MSKQEILHEITKVLDRFSDQSLEELLTILEKIEKEKTFAITAEMLGMLFNDDDKLLRKLAQ
jgi:hypothetical protein